MHIQRGVQPRRTYRVPVVYLFEKIRAKGIGIIDVHAHVFFKDQLNLSLLKALNSFNVERAYVSIYPFELGSLNPSPEDVYKGNLKVLELCRRNRVLRGLVFLNQLNPIDVERAEFFIKEGFSGIGELYRSAKLRGRIAEPIMRLASEYDVPVLVHTAHRLYPADRPREMTPRDVALLARKWPRVRIVMSHIAGGGDWEYALEVVKEYGNIYVDVGGSVQDSGIIERAVSKLGAHRVLFASDNLLAQSVGRVESANLDEETKVLIYRENALKVFKD